MIINKQLTSDENKQLISSNVRKQLTKGLCKQTAENVIKQLTTDVIRIKQLTSADNVNQQLMPANKQLPPASGNVNKQLTLYTNS